MQWDTSEHDWLEGRGEKLQLIGMIDDASSESLARFVRHDSSEENRRLLKTYLEQNGRPVAFYTDRASLFVNTPKNSAGEDPKLLPPTQIGRALQELGIESITAYSPQAKGRVERSFGTAQDRLVKGLRVAGATTIEQANAYLESEFLPWWNATLRVRPAHPDEAHRELGPEHDLDSALSHVETRRVANDYTIRFRGKSYQIDRKAIVPGLRNGRVRVESRLDGVLVARFGKHELALKRCGAQPQSERARAKSAQPKNTQAESVQAEPASAAAEKAGGKAAGRGGSDWMKDFDLKDSPPVWKAAQASGARPDAKPRPYGERRANDARRSSRWRSPRPQLRSFTKAISVKNRKPSDREARGSSALADCLGASSIASALGIKSRRDPALNAHHSTIASPASCPKADISTWQRLGHFYLALTGRVKPPLTREP